MDKLFALRHKKTQKLLRFYIRSNDGAEFSSATCKVFSIDDDEMHLFITEHKDLADYVRKHGDWWFNGVEHNFKPDELEVVQVYVTVVAVES